MVLASAAIRLTTNNDEMKTPSLGSISHGTLRTEDLLSSFASCLEDCISANGAMLALPENRAMRDRLAKLLGEAQDAWADDGETLTDEDNASELVNELQDALNEFAPAYCTFGAHPGDGADFGFWPDVEQAREDCGFVSSKRNEYPEDDFRGEWMHVNDHGNCTLYVREDAPDSRATEQFNDREIWSVV